MTIPPSTPTTEQHAAPHRVLVLVDARPDSRAAVIWASHWCKRMGDDMELLHVIEPDQLIGFGLVHDAVQAERIAEATLLLDDLSALAERLCNKVPTRLIRQGTLKNAARDCLQSEVNLSLVVMAASHREAGPAPFIGYLASRMGSRVAVPLVLVPGTMGEEEIDDII